MPQRIPLDILSFLHSYRMHPCLWDRTHPQFKNRSSRDEAEAVLLPISGLSSVKELRQKIRNIRCTYNQELGKIRRSINAGLADIYEPKLVWFPFADSFLRVNHIEKFEDPSSILAYNSQPEYNGGYPPVFLKQEFRVAEANYPTPEDPEPASVQSPPPNPPPVHPPPSKKFKPAEVKSENRGNPGYQQQSHHYSSLTEFVETVAQSPAESAMGSSNNNNNSPPYPDNEFVVFGQHVAAQLQQLPLDDAIKLEEEIQSAITRVRLRSMQEQQ